MIYCDTIFIHWTFNIVYFVGRATHEIKTPTKYLLIFINFSNLKSMNSSVYENVYHRLTIKIQAYVIK